MWLRISETIRLRIHDMGPPTERSIERVFDEDVSGDPFVTMLNGNKKREMSPELTEYVILCDVLRPRHVSLTVACTAV